MKTNGCWGCKHLEWWEADPESFESSGYYCGNRDDEPHIKFKVFPCERKLKCKEQITEEVEC